MIFKVYLNPLVDSSNIANFEANYKALSTPVLLVDDTNALLPSYAQFLSDVETDWDHTEYIELTTPNGTSYSLFYIQENTGDINLDKIAPASNETITADGYSAYVSDHYEIVLSYFLEIGLGSYFEIG